MARDFRDPSVRSSFVCAGGTGLVQPVRLMIDQANVSLFSS